MGVSTTDTDFTLSKQGGAKTFSLDCEDIGAMISVSPDGELEWKRKHNAHYNNAFYSSIRLNPQQELQPNAEGVGLFGLVSTVQPYIAVSYWRRTA